MTVTTLENAPPRTRVEVDQLVGAKEIAERLGWTAGAVHNWARRHKDFPEPLVTLKCGRIWHWRDVLVWAMYHGKDPMMDEVPDG